MRKIIISGFTIADTEIFTGVQRVSREIILRIDKLLENKNIDVEYFYIENAPHNVIKLEEFKNIKPVAIKSTYGRGRIPRLWDIPRYVKKQKAVLGCIDLDYARVKGYIPCIHDIRPLVAKDLDDKRFIKNYKKLFVGLAKRYAKKIVTVSEFQKQLLVEKCKIQPERIQVIYNGWEHMSNIECDNSIFEKNPLLKEKEYFYTLANIAPNKNYKWIYEVAKRNPNKIFAVAGMITSFGNAQKDINLENIKYLDRVSDEENKALMTNCKAFLFPSKFEGFGLPPLEALSCGATICISNATCLPEIYKDSAHYFDPNDYDVDLDKLILEPVADAKKVLTKCSWDNAAKQWLNLLVSEASNGR